MAWPSSTPLFWVLHPDPVIHACGKDERVMTKTIVFLLHVLLLCDLLRLLFNLQGVFILEMVHVHDNVLVFEVGRCHQKWPRFGSFPYLPVQHARNEAPEQLNAKHTYMQNTFAWSVPLLHFHTECRFLPLLTIVDLPTCQSLTYTKPALQDTDICITRSFASHWWQVGVGMVPPKCDA